MQGVLYLSIILILAVATTCLQNYYCKNLLHSICDNLLFLIIVYAISAILMAVMNGVRPISSYTLLLAVVYGALLTVETFCGLEAMRRGSMSLTVMFQMSSLVVPILVGVFVWKESITAIQIAGTLLMLAAMAMILNAVKRDGQKMTASWFILAVITFLAAGADAITQKTLTYSAYAAESEGFLLTGYLTAIVATCGIFLYNKKVKNEPVTMKITAKDIIPIAMVGVIGAVIGLLFLKAMAFVPTSVLFPVNNGGRLILVTVADVLLFKQKLTKLQYAGLVLGTTAIILLSI